MGGNNKLTKSCPTPEGGIQCGQGHQQQRQRQQTPQQYVQQHQQEQRQREGMSFRLSGSSNTGPGLRGSVNECHDWSGYWVLQLLKWRQFDLLSIISSVVLNTNNVWRCTITSSSYSTPAHIGWLRQVQAWYVLALPFYLGTAWLLLRRPLAYQRYRTPLTIGRSMLIAMLVICSVPLPLYHSMRLPPLCGGSGVSSLIELVFHCGAFYSITIFLFHPLPWQLAGLNGLLYATLCGACVPRVYCGYVVAATAAASSPPLLPPPQQLQQQPHPDAAMLHGLANRLDQLTGQGSMGQVGGGAAAAAGGNTQGQQGWQSDTAIIAAACPPALVAAGGGGGGGGCAASLHGQCQAVVMMLHFTIVLLMTTLVFVNERVNKWRYLQHPGARLAPQLGDGGSSSSSSTEARDSANERAPAVQGAGSRRGLLGSPYDAPSLAVLVRNEALRFVLLLDLPLLMLWWGLSSWLRLPLLVAGAREHDLVTGA